MADLLLRFLLMARQRERSRWRRLLFPHEALIAGGLEQVVEAALARIHVASQHERHRVDTVERPASRQQGVVFFDEARPDRPRPPELRHQAVQRFPLRASLVVFTCPSCGGAGKVACGGCDGTGRVACVQCSGQGRSGGGRCTGCHGSGKQRHHACGGTGKVPDRRCAGEGRLATWQEEVYTWVVRHQHAEHHPVAPPQARVRRALDRWLETRDERVVDLTHATTQRHLGYLTAEARAVVDAANTSRMALEAGAQRLDARYLYHQTDRYLVPAGFLVRRVGGRPRWYWLVGRGAGALEVAPLQRPGLPHISAWGVALLGLLLVEEALVAATGWTWPRLSAWLPALADLPPAATGLLGTGALLGAAAGGAAALHPPPSTLCVAILPVGSSTSALLAVLASLGSYLRVFDVVDRVYDDQIEVLLGKPSNRRQSSAVSLRLASGVRIHLLEVARAESMEDGALTELVAAADGIVLLGAPSNRRDRLRRRVEAAMPDRAPVPLVAVDPERDLRVEDVRRTWVRQAPGELPWPTVFTGLWAPLARLLPEAAVALPTRAPDLEAP